MRAFGNHSVRRCREHLDQTRFVQLPAPLEHAKGYALARQRTLDENGLAVDARDAPAIMREIHDHCLLHVAELQVAGHAAANSLKCAAADSCSNFRTRATSPACSAEFKWPRSSWKRKYTR